MATPGLWRRRILIAAAIIALPMLVAIAVESWRQMQISSSHADLDDAIGHARASVLGGKTPAQFSQGRVKGTNGYERLRKVAEALENASPIGPGTFEAAGGSSEFTPKGVSLVLGVEEWPNLKREPPDTEKTRLFLLATEPWAAELEAISRGDVIAQVIHDRDTYGDVLGGDSLSWLQVHLRTVWVMLARANANALLGNSDLAVRQLLIMARLCSLMRVPMYELQLSTRAWGFLATLRVGLHWVAAGVVAAQQLKDLISFNMDCESLFLVAAESEMASKILYSQWAREWPSEVWFGWARPDIEDSPFDDRDGQNKYTRGLRYRQGFTTGLSIYAAQVLELRGQAPPYTLLTTDQQGLVMSANLQSASVRIHDSQLEIDTARAEIDRLLGK